MLPRFYKNFKTLTNSHKLYPGRSPQFVKMLPSELLLSDSIKPKKRTKSVCTIG